MAVEFIKGNIFNTKSQVIVNTVNCVGVMGKGIALVFKLRYPTMYDIYKEHCRNNLIEIGTLWLYKATPEVPWVLNFPTKKHWKYPSKLEYIDKGLSKFLTSYKKQGITSIAFPILGAHNGGLDKNDVLMLMNKYFSQCDIKIEIYEYDPYAPDDLFEQFKLKWNNLELTNLKIATGIRSQKQISQINEAVNSNTVTSMISLLECEGIGLKTIEKCFNFVINSKTANLFD